MSRSENLGKGTKFAILRNFEIGYDFRFDPIKAFLEKTQEMINIQEKELSDKYKKWNEEHLSNPEIPDAFEVYEMEIINGSEFRNILNQSIYLTIYSTFESEFFELCEWCQHAEELKIGPKDIKEQNYLGQCRNFIIKVLNVDLNKMQNQWAEIRKYQTLRNAIAHKNGILKDSDQESLNFIENINGISVKSSLKIEIDSIEFLKTFIDKLIKFLTGTIEEIIRQKGELSI